MIIGRFPAIFSGIFIFLLATLSASNAAFCSTNSIQNSISRPDSYDLFVNVREYPSLEKAIEKNKYIYLPPGEYRINNPIVIDRTDPLFMHGGSRMDTILKPKNPAQPLFIIKNASLINFAGLYFLGAPVMEYRMLFFQNIAPLQFEMLDCFFDQSILNIQGPGSYRVQGTYVSNRGMSKAPIVIDHPLADLLIIGGNMQAREEKTPLVSGNFIFNVWQKRGRLRIYGAGVQRSAGIADYRIDTASALGPHVLAYIRSEGTNGYRPGNLASAFLYVPSSTEKVDVLMMANGGLWPTDSRNINLNHFINYNAAGTVWMIGNSAPNNANHIAVGTAPAATIVAMGNRIFSGTRDPFPIQAKTRYNLGNTFFYAGVDRKAFPIARFLDIPGTVTSIDSAPPVPEDPLPVPLTRPTMNQALPGMLDAKRDFGAKGDGITDDTAALQKALVSGKVIFIPMGVYRTTRTLGFAHSVYGGKPFGAGGWIAGAGMNKTIIRRDVADKGSVFATEGMAYITIQGISFETADYHETEADPIDVPAVEMEFNPKFIGAFATQEVMFYDCRFKGGRYAASIGLKTTTMGSENMFINSEFKNAKYGLGIGSYNALQNIAYGSYFNNNEITMGQDNTRNSGGSGALLNVKVSGTKKQEIVIYNTDGAPWYFNGVKSTTQKLFKAGHSSIPFQLIFDHCEFDPQPPSNSWASSLSGGGLYFIHSLVTNGSLDISSVMSVMPVFSLHSKFEDLHKTQKGANGRVYRLP